MPDWVRFAAAVETGVRRGRRAIRRIRDWALAVARPCYARFALGRARAPRSPKVNIEQSFAGSLTAVPQEKLGVSGGFYVPAYSSVSLSHGKVRADSR